MEGRVLFNAVFFQPGLQHRDLDGLDGVVDTDSSPRRLSLLSTSHHLLLADALRAPATLKFRQWMFSR